MGGGGLLVIHAQTQVSVRKFIVRQRRTPHYGCDQGIMRRCGFAICHAKAPSIQADCSPSAACYTLLPWRRARPCLADKAARG